MIVVVVNLDRAPLGMTGGHVLAGGSVVWLRGARMRVPATVVARIGEGGRRRQGEGGGQGGGKDPFAVHRSAPVQVRAFIVGRPDGDAVAIV
jgi:hypothetical protein